MPTDAEIREEQKKINRLRFLVDFTISVINQGRLPLNEVYRLVDGLKKHALMLFPDKENTFELIYRPRITRAIRENYRFH